MGKASDQPSQHKLDTLKNTIINEGIEIIGLAKVNSNWSKIPIKDNIYNRIDRWFKTRRTRTGYKRVTIYNRTFESGGTYIMAVYEVSCRVIATGQEFRNLRRWSCILLQGNNNIRTIMITAYFPTVSDSEIGAYSQQL